MKVALFGAGRIGQIHAQNIASHPRSHLSIIVDPNQDAAHELAGKHGAQVGNLEAVFNDPHIGAVVIASSTDQHAEQIERASKAQKAIFCEKPIDLNIDRVRDVIAHLRIHPVPFMLGFNRRFDPNFMAMKAQIEAGAIGDIEMITILSRDPRLPPIEYIKVSGGLFRDMMIHDFDIARWLAGEDFTTVQAVGSALVDTAVETAGDVDTAVVNMRTSSGKLVSITNSRRATYGYDQRIEVHGSKGMISAENVRESTVILSNEDGVKFEKPMDFFLERYAQAYKNEWDGFVGLVLDGVDNVPTADDGIAALHLAEQAIVSNQSIR